MRKPSEELFTHSAEDIKSGAFAGEHLRCSPAFVLYIVGSHWVFACLLCARGCSCCAMWCQSQLVRLAFDSWHGTHSFKACV